MRAYTCLTLSSLALISAQSLASTHDPISFSGYLDASFVSEDVDDTTEDDFTLDALELRFLYQGKDNLSVVAHVRGSSDEDFELEQAHLNYQVNNNLNIVAGKFLSIQGWEAFHAPDLYQFSTSATLVYPGMMNGASVTYSNDDFTFHGAIVASAWDSKDTETDDNAYDLAIQVKSIPDVTIHLGYTTEEIANYDQALTNLWASYSKHGLTLAAEYNHLEDWGGKDYEGDGWLVMANYEFTERIALTLRTSALEVENAADFEITDIEKWTISPSYKVSEDLLLVFEYSETENNLLSGGDSDLFAIEAIVTF
ncbi:porin [Thalassomonas viridans]|uniref:Porin n=1 Tax=Thalassomonas viridans TaxID=137584 RepID=A0AAF0C7L5_9GAMM|nr:porin [Thalassomonas viridans]WDE02984.1 porin [Thalassomonas viridans]